MLALTPPTIRLDRAAYERLLLARDAHAGWQAQQQDEWRYTNLATECRKRLAGERRGLLDRVMRREADIPEEEVRLALYREGVSSPDRTLSGHQHRHPGMSRMTAAEAKATIDAAGEERIEGKMLVAAMVAAAVGMVSEFRNGRVTAYVEQVDRMETAMRERRFSTFWDAAALVTSIAGQITVTDGDLDVLAGWWSGMTAEGATDWTRLQCLLITIFGKGDVVLTVPIADDGPRLTQPASLRTISGIRDVSSLSGSHLSDATGIAVVDRPLTVGVDAERAAIIADAHARFAAALDAADRDADMALIGQQYKIRLVLLDSSIRMEQAVGQTSAALLHRMREDSARVGATLATVNAAAQEAAASASMANARLVGAVQAAGDRIDASLGRIPAGWRVG